MITVKQLLEAFEKIEQEELEKKQKAEEEKIRQQCNGHYTSYNRCYYLKYRPEDEYLILEVIKHYINKYKEGLDNYKLKKLLNLQTRLQKHHIYWKLENK